MAETIFYLAHLFNGPFPYFMLVIAGMVGMFLTDSGRRTSHGQSEGEPSPGQMWWQRWKWAFEAIAAVLVIIAARIGLLKVL